MADRLPDRRERFVLLILAERLEWDEISLDDVERITRRGDRFDWIVRLKASPQPYCVTDEEMAHRGF